MANVQLMQGDCLQLMQDIPNGSIDCIICDLPFGVTQNSWDKKLPLDELWKQYNRIAKINAAVVLNCQQPFTSELIMSNLKNFKYCWTWYKKQCSGFLNSKKQPLRNCEDIAVFYRKQCTYNPQMRKGKPQLKNTGGTLLIITSSLINHIFQTITTLPLYLKCLYRELKVGIPHKNPYLCLNIS